MTIVLIAVLAVVSVLCVALARAMFRRIRIFETDAGDSSGTCAARAAVPPRVGYRFAADALRERPNGPRVKPARFTDEPVDRLGLLAAPRWSSRARHVGVVSRIVPPVKPGKPALARLTYVNREGGRALPLRKLRVVTM